ncbi:hypothetical protein FRY98_16035 [Paenibacillus faecis]|uniref:Uncharacterized protein n=1 Tax=Paenibacillus faecis TaxID=862114 RepID=A0A5D0CRG6_9BACL|nr:hypothetical protein [Paenibacillus faecis]TYA12220.1 hypothetical protein FRY98_16035 [Paenibacillus faecis]
MLIKIKNELKFKNILAYVLAVLSAALISSLLYVNNAYADLQGIFYPDSKKSTYGTANNGTGYTDDLAYSYWRSETAQGNSDTPSTLRFFNVKTSNGSSKPSGAQFGVYKIVDLKEKRFLDWYTKSIDTQLSVNMDYTADMGSLYTEMTVYADPKGIDGAQMNVRYDRYAYTTR